MENPAWKVGFFICRCGGRELVLMSETSSVVYQPTDGSPPGVTIFCPADFNFEIETDQCLDNWFGSEDVIYKIQLMCFINIYSENENAVDTSMFLGINNFNGCII